MRTITLTNYTQSIPSDALKKLLPEMQEFIDADVQRFWGRTALLRVEEVREDCAPILDPEEPLRIFESREQAERIGFHAPREDGDGEGFVCLSDIPGGYQRWLLRLSQELVAQVVDPLSRLAMPVLLPPAWGGLSERPALIALEPWEPVAGGYYYRGPFPCANFVYPWWYLDTAQKREDGYDRLGVLSRPLQVAPGGMVSYSLDMLHWQTFGRYTADSHPLSRFARRRDPGEAEYLLIQ